MESVSGKRLKLLCLHGIDTTAEIMKYQMQQFETTFAPIIDLVYLDAPHKVGRARYEAFKAKGFEGPYREWMGV